MEKDTETLREFANDVRALVSEYLYSNDRFVRTPEQLRPTLIVAPMIEFNEKLAAIEIKYGLHHSEA